MLVEERSKLMIVKKDTKLWRILRKLKKLRPKTLQGQKHDMKSSHQKTFPALI